jgi:hypothetical protein
LVVPGRQISKDDGPIFLGRASPGDFTASNNQTSVRVRPEWQCYDEGGWRVEPEDKVRSRLLQPELAREKALAVNVQVSGQCHACGVKLDPAELGRSVSHCDSPKFVVPYQHIRNVRQRVSYTLEIDRYRYGGMFP